MKSDSLFFTHSGTLTDEFVLNLVSEGIGILFSVVFITTALRATQVTSRWLSVRRPRRRLLEDSREDAQFTLTRVRRVAQSTNASEVRENLQEYMRALVAMARRLELARDLFPTRDFPLIIGFVADVHIVNSIIETDCELNSVQLPLTTQSKVFHNRRGDPILTSALDYYTQMFFTLDRLFIRYGLPEIGVSNGYAEDFKLFLRTNFS